MASSPWRPEPFSLLVQPLSQCILDLTPPAGGLPHRVCMLQLLWHHLLSGLGLQGPPGFPGHTEESGKPPSLTSATHDFHSSPGQTSLSPCPISQRRRLRLQRLAGTG